MGAKLGRRFLKQPAEKLKAVFVAYNAIYFTLVRVNATLVRKNRPLATGRGIRGQGP